MNDSFNATTKLLVWKGETNPNYYVDSTGNIFRAKDGYRLLMHVINGRHYVYINHIDNHCWEWRVDYIVAYTFLGKPEDAIRLVHIDDNNLNDNLSNLMWYRKIDVMREYIDLAIIENNGSIIEEWRDCKLEHPCNKEYEVSNFGMIRDKHTKELTILKESHGYRVFYYIDKEFAKQTRIKAVHRAVAEAFIPNPNNYQLINHLDGDPFNDIVSNLEWASNGMNSEHAYIQGLHKKSRYTIRQIETVCDLLSRTKVPHVQISFMTGVDRKTISDILRKRRWREVSDKYIFPIKKWNNSMKDEVKRLIISGMKGHEIFTQLGINYDQSAISFYERMRRELKSVGLVK